ncbi:MAG TPA: methanogen output domain 1-containing protein [Methanobacterium sp.]|nr:methanogen output domain 1-containing protein [Methanobacterium sp.]
MSSVKILVVEDESIVAMDIKHRLEAMDYDVPEIVSSGEDAVEKAALLIPDLILMDIVLRGDMDGIQAAQIIKDNYDIPIVYLTAYSDEKTLKRAKITGPFGYIIKPFEDRELHSAIEVALYKHEMESKLTASEKWLSTTLESIGEAVITTDDIGNVTFMNPMAQKITGWDQEDSIGNPLENIFKIIDEKTGEHVDFSIDTLLEKDSITDINDNILLITKQGTKLPINNTNAPIMDDKNKKNGIVLVFQDITQRRIAEKEREQLLKEKARSELFGFLLSAMPVFASNIPPQIRNNIAKSFADRFEKNIRPGFEENISNCLSIKEAKNSANIFNCYMEWIQEFLSNLGIEAIEHDNKIIFSNCPWEKEARYSPMFCLICRIIVIRSFTWASIRGHVEQVSCMADESKGCVFQFILSSGT